MLYRSCYAEYAAFPLENVHALDEHQLLHTRGLSIRQLSAISVSLVAFGGLSSIDVKAGDVVLAIPATGAFGSAAVCMALGLGATVIAGGRTEATLKALVSKMDKDGRLSYVTLSGDAEVDGHALKAATPGSLGATAYIDFSPPAAAQSTHFLAGIKALRPYGKIALMGGIKVDIPLPYHTVTRNNLSLVGRHMYSRKDVTRFLSILTAGNLQLYKRSLAFKLDQVEQALKAAEDNRGWETQIIFEP